MLSSHFVANSNLALVHYKLGTPYRNQIKQLMPSRTLVFEERRKPEYPEKKKERLRFCKRWPCSTYIWTDLTDWSVMWSAKFLHHMNQVSVSPTDGNGPTQRQRKPLTRVGIEDQSAEQRWSNPKVVGSIPTFVRAFLCPCVGPFPSVGLTLTWLFKGSRNLALHITL